MGCYPLGRKQERDKMKYLDRLKKYEQEKKQLKSLSAAEYEKAVREIAKKWGI